MSDTWITDITHFLDDTGNLIEEPKEARALADYFTAILVMATYPEPDYPPEYLVSCRRRPQRKPCREEIVGFIDPETDAVVWMCPKCNDRGLISNWQGTIWDMSKLGEIDH
jgi:hypothetical protein